MVNTNPWPQEAKKAHKKHFDDKRDIHRRRLEAIKSFYGGITGVWRAYQYAGYVFLTRKAVEKWFERGRLPDDKFKVMIMYIIQENKNDEFYEHIAKIGITPEDIYI